MRYPPPTWTTIGSLREYKKLIARAGSNRACRCHPDFHGTAQIYNSPFWELIISGPTIYLDAMNFVAKCLAQTGMRRITESEDWRVRHGDPYLSKTEPPEHQSRMLRIYTASFLRSALDGRETTLDILALVGRLYREADLAQRGHCIVKFALRGHFHCPAKPIPFLTQGGRPVLPAAPAD